MSTRICDDCEQEVDSSETKCPKCGADFAEQDEIASAVERGNSILEKRKKRAQPAPAPETTPTPVKTTLSQRLRALGKGFNRKES